MSSKVSFTIRRPTPVSRAASSTPDSDAGASFKVPHLPPHISAADSTSLGSPLARSATSSPGPDIDQRTDADSSDEDSAAEDELVTGFDKFGVQRLNGEKKVAKPLVIPALKNKDWRELARKRRGAATYVPPSAAAMTGKDGSVGGLGTRDSINSGPVLSGLQVKTRTAVDDENEEDSPSDGDVKMEVVEEETEDQRAIRAILAESSGEGRHDGPVIDVIPAPISETDALRQDVEELPDVATIEDYARVPVSQFGAALLRGMGWKEGTAATRKPGKGLVEPYLPAARPALLGIGAKEQEAYDDGSKKNGKSQRPERRYVPVIRQERAESANGDSRDRRKRERSRSPRRSAPTSRRSSPGRYKDTGGAANGRSSRALYDEGRGSDMDMRRTDDRSDRHRNDDREKDRDRRERDSGRDKERREHNYVYDSGSGRDRGGRSDRKDSAYDSSRRR